MYTIFNMFYFEVFGITQDLDFRMSLSVDQCILIIMQMENLFTGKHVLSCVNN